MTADDDQAAAVTLEVLRDIWPGDATKATVMLMALERNHANLPPDERNSAILHDALQLAAMLIR